MHGRNNVTNSLEFSIFLIYCLCTLAPFTTGMINITILVALLKATMPY